MRDHKANAVVTNENIKQEADMHKKIQKMLRLSVNALE